MKIFIALTALVSVAFAQHCLENCGLDAKQVTCLPNGAGITVQLGPSNYSPELQATLRSGSCAFDPSGKLEAKFGSDDCGVNQEVQGATIINSATIKSLPPSGPITRLAKVEVMVACTYNTATKQSAQSFINPNIETIKGDLKGEGEYNLELNIVDTEGKPITGALDIEVNKPVSATISGAGEGMQARATKCWATPEADTTDKNQMWVLMDEGCAIDSTFESSIGADNNQLITFLAFAWSDKTGGSVFLHCNLEACEEGGDCGECQPPAARAPARKRREIMTMKMNKKEQKNMMVKMNIKQ